MEEWARQAPLYVRFARYAARCEAAAAEAELAVKTVTAELFSKYKLTDLTESKKPSDETVKQRIYADMTYVQVEMYRIQMVERSRIAAGLVRAADQRQYALSHLSKKHLGGMFMTPDDLGTFTDKVLHAASRRTGITSNT